MTQAILLDTETTGLIRPDCFPLDSQPRIIEIGMLRVELGDPPNIIESISEFVNPLIGIPRFITRLTGIHNEDVMGAPTFDQVLPSISRLARYSESHNVPIYAHNADFDLRVIEYECLRFGLLSPLASCQVVCTQLETRWIKGKFSKLVDCAEFFAEGEVSQTHRAVDDCKLLATIVSECKALQ